MKKLYLILFTLLSIGATAQESSDRSFTEFKTYLNILSPSVGFEMGISENQSIMVAGGVRFLNDNITGDQEGSLNPFARLDFRNFYSKRTDSRFRSMSGAFIGFTSGYVFEGLTDESENSDFEDENEFYFAGVWGMQRNYRSRLRWSFHLGPGIRIVDGDVKGAFNANLTFGFVLGN